MKNRWLVPDRRIQEQVVTPDPSPGPIAEGHIVRVGRQMKIKAFYVLSLKKF
jgi:hypothetical protein